MNKKHSLDDKMKSLVRGGGDDYNCSCVYGSNAKPLKRLVKNLPECHRWCCKEQSAFGYVFADSVSHIKCQSLDDEEKQLKSDYLGSLFAAYMYRVSKW